MSRLKQSNVLEIFESDDCITVRNLSDKPLYISRNDKGKPVVSAKKNNNAFILNPKEFVTFSMPDMTIRESMQEPIHSIPAEWS